MQTPYEKGDVKVDPLASLRAEYGKSLKFQNQSVGIEIREQKESSRPQHPVMIGF